MMGLVFWLFLNTTWLDVKFDGAKIDDPVFFKIHKKSLKPLF